MLENFLLCYSIMLPIINLILCLIILASLQVILLSVQLDGSNVTVNIESGGHREGILS